jgi:hypothetical protein
MGETNFALDVRLSLRMPTDDGVPFFVNGFGDFLEKVLVVGRLGDQQEVHLQVFQQTDVGRVARQTISHHDHRQMRMFPAELDQQSLGRIALAVAFVGSVLVDNGLGCQGTTVSLSGWTIEAARTWCE